MPAQTHLHLEETNGVAVACLTEHKIREEHQVRELCEELAQVIKQGHVQVAIDFGAVDYLSTPALSALVALYKRTRYLGTRIVLFNVSEDIHALFRITRLEELFPIYASEQEALEKV